MHQYADPPWERRVHEHWKIAMQDNLVVLQVPTRSVALAIWDSLTPKARKDSPPGFAVSKLVLYIYIYIYIYISSSLPQCALSCSKNAPTSDSTLCLAFEA